MKKMVYIYEKVKYTHAIEVDVQDEDELENFINNVDCGRYEDSDDAIKWLQRLRNVKVIGVEKNYDSEIDEMECDSDETEE